MTPPILQPADVLTDVLESVHVEVSCYGSLRLGAPWGVQIPQSEHAMFYGVVQGSAHLTVGEQERTLQVGDLVALPQGHLHELRDSPERPVATLEELMNHQPCGSSRVYAAGGDGDVCSLVWGCFRFGQRQSHPLLSALPALIALEESRCRNVPWLETTLKFIACEIQSGRPGGQTVVARLADVLFVQILRAHLSEQRAVNSGWLAALAEPQIATALGLIHRSPAEAWTVASLASRVGMSRSAFAARFSQLVGEPPLQYVTRWRMQKAANLLRERQATLAEVAQHVGYDSETAFSKAFKRSLGLSPGAYRKQGLRQRVRVA